MRYGVMLRGENFEIKSDSGVQNLGFFTTRFVKAKNPKEAELLAVSMVRTDKYLLESMHKDTMLEPKIYLEEIWPVSWWKRPSGKGYTFYEMQTDESTST